MIAITKAIILTIILIEAKIKLKSPVRSIVSNKYNPVIINRMICIILTSLLLVIKTLLSIVLYPPKHMKILNNIF
jgi:hypothetical protein